MGGWWGRCYYDVAIVARFPTDIPAKCLSRRTAAAPSTSAAPYSVKVCLELAEQPTQFRT